MARKKKSLEALSERSAAARRRALKAIDLMRHGASLTDAARRAGADPRTVKKYGRPALRRDRRTGRYKAKAQDGIQRPMLFPTPKGHVSLLIEGSRDASLVGKYWGAFKLVASGRADAEALRAFEGKSVTVGGKVYPFVTDLDVVLQLALAEPVFEDIYAHVR